ncbi:MAG: pyridoxal phosphate-dependent aminotransferase [Fervidicoccaceae archaeon]
MRKISSRSKQISPSPHRILVSKLDELIRSGKKVYNFSAGQPGFPPDENLIRMTFEHALKDSFNHYKYLPPAGLEELRVAVSNDLKKYGKFDVEPSNIVITEGGIEGLNLTFFALADPGDEVLFLDPSYSVYWDLAKMYGLKLKTCSQTIDNEFQPDEECLKEKITRTTSFVLVTSPDNPTSRILRESTMKLIADLAIDNDVWLLYDEAYKHIVYEGEHVWIQRYSRTMERLVGINSFSKDIAIPGLRLGYTYAPKEVIKELAKLKGLTSISSSTSAQWMAYFALTTNIKEEYLRRVIPLYKNRRDKAYEAVRKYLPEAKVWKPPAGMYLFPDISAYMEKYNIKDDVEFAYRLAEERQVIMLPGSIFGSSGRGHLRITFVTQPEEKIEKGIETLGEYLNEAK